MLLRADAVDAALDRWERAKLLSPEVAASLRAEAQRHAAQSGRRTAQYALAATGGAVLLVAAGVLGDWLWPRMEVGGRTLVLALVGVAVHGIGLYLRWGERWRPASYLLQTAGLLILLGTYMYSEAAWADVTAGGTVIGVLALMTPLVAAPRSLLRREPVMPGVHLALFLGFLAVFLDRATSLSADAIVWVLDAVLVVLAALLLLELRRAREAEETEWALNAFVMALYAGLVLLITTSMGPLNLEEESVYPIDVWLLLVTGLTLWAIHGAPPALQRHWYERQLGLAILMWIPLLFFTVDELLDAPSEVAALCIATVGALGLRHAIRYGGRSTLASSCLALTLAAWYYGVDRGGALGAVLALAATAALLFWVSTRVGWRGGGADAETPEIRTGL